MSEDFDPNDPTDEIRGDPADPSIQFQRELATVVDRYADVSGASPGYVAATLVEYADILRSAADYDVTVEQMSEEVYVATFGEMSAWIGAPRTGMYGDLDTDALDALVEGDLTVVEDAFDG